MDSNCIGFGIYMHPDNVFKKVNVFSGGMTITYENIKYTINLNDESENRNV